MRRDEKLSTHRNNLSEVFCTIYLSKLETISQKFIITLIIINKPATLLKRDPDTGVLQKVQKQPPEVFWKKKVFLEILQNSRENVVCTSILAQVPSCEFCKIPKNTFFSEHLWATTSESFAKFSRRPILEHLPIS